MPGEPSSPWGHRIRSFTLIEPGALGRARGLLLIAASCAGLALAGPAVATAETTGPFNCDATALQATLLDTPPAITLGAANVEAPACQDANGDVLVIPPELGLPLSASVIDAETSVAAAARSAASSASLEGLSVGLGEDTLNSLDVPLQSHIQELLERLPLTELKALPAGSLATLLAPLVALPVVGELTSDLTVTKEQLAAALQTALERLTREQLGGAPIGLGRLASSATAQCVGGAVTLSGSSSVADLTLLGQPIPSEGLTSPTLELLDTERLETVVLNEVLPELLSGVEAALDHTTASAKLGPMQPALEAVVQELKEALAGPGGVSATLSPSVQQLLTEMQPALNQLFTLTVAPNQQLLASGQLTQTALHADLTLAGQQVLDLNLGRARVSDASVSCAGTGNTAEGAGGSSASPGSSGGSSPSGANAAGVTGPEANAARAALQCTRRGMTLINVVQRGNRTFIEGAAEAALVGKEIPIYLTHGNRRVGTAKVQPSGIFSTTAPLPPARIRNTNAAAYYATYGRHITSKLKFRRRMIIDSITASTGQVHIVGHIVAPLSKPLKSVVFQRRLSCATLVNVKTIRPRPDGRFSVALPAPANNEVGVYSATTQVPKTLADPRLFATFTLPAYVELS